MGDGYGSGMVLLNCPNCGDGFAPRFAAMKMATCASCATTLYLVGDHLKDAGASGDMHDAPSLFQVGQTVRTKLGTVDVHGHARFDYGRGWWDEFFATTHNGTEVWISVDEGDIILQEAVPPKDAPPGRSRPDIGRVVTAFGEEFRVMERSEAQCIAVRGEFPEVLYVGSEYSYVNCQGDGAQMLSGEFSTGAPDWYIGQWIDPFDITAEGAA